MFQRKKHNLIPMGDYVTLNESMSGPEEDVERRCETVTEVVKKKIFTLDHALSLYNVSLRQYIGHLMLRNQSRVITDSAHISAITAMLLDLMDLSEKRLDSRTEKIVAGLRQLSTV